MLDNEQKTGLSDACEKLDHEAFPSLIIISGMSGAGRSETMHFFEDLGYFCVDNLPSSLLGSLVQMDGMPASENPSQRLAVVCDARNGHYFNGLKSELAKLDELNVAYSIIFLDAADEKLVARYKASRRRHPLCDDGNTILRGIQRERDLLFELREAASLTVDTTAMLPQQLRATIRSHFQDYEARESMSVSVYSFGFKHAAPLDADLVIDVRFLPNPYYDPILRPMCGLDAPVRDFVMMREETIAFQKAWHQLLDCVMPGYLAEGKQQLAIAVGCTGGQHRSVCLAESTCDYLLSRGYRASVAHRDLHLAIAPSQDAVAGGE